VLATITVMTAASATGGLADLAGVPWIFDPADTAPGQWARNELGGSGTL